MSLKQPDDFQTGFPPAQTVHPRFSAPHRLLILAILICFSPAILPADEVDYPQFNAGMDIHGGIKVDSQGETNHRFDSLSFQVEMGFSEYSRGFARIDLADYLGYNAFGSANPEDWVSGESFYRDSEFFLETDVLRPSSSDSIVDLKLNLGYGEAQELFRMDFTGFQFERSNSSGIDGLDLSATLGLAKRFYLNAAFNPSSINTAGSNHPDVFASLFMDNNHRGSSWGPLIQFHRSSMQLFYDSSSYFRGSPSSEAFSLGIGGHLTLDFAGIEILGFGMTEFFVMYKASQPDVIQAEWAAGFEFPVLSELVLNLSGSNAVVVSESGEGSFMNFGLDVRAMFTDVFGVFAAAGAIGILDSPGASFEGGIRLKLGDFQFDTGYSHHALWTDAQYARGAFDRTKQDDGLSLGGGFFLSYLASF